MNASTSSGELSRRSYLAHWGAAVLATIAAAIVQANWPTAMSAWGTEAWWPWVLAVMLTTTVWLLSTAWLHWRLAHTLDEDPIERLTRLVMNAVSDSLVAVLAAVSLYRGSESRLLLAGLSLVPPALIAVAAASIVAMAVGMTEAWGRKERGPSRTQVQPRARERWRTVIAVALFIAFGFLSSQPLPAG